MAHSQSQSGPSLPATLQSAGRWFIIGTAVIGATLGIYVGLSSTPVVAAALPLIMGAAGGVAGVMIAKANLDSDVAIWRLRCAGASASAFGVMAIAGGLVGIGLRTGSLSPSDEPIAMQSPPPFGFEALAQDAGPPALEELSMYEQSLLIALEAVLHDPRISSLQRTSLVSHAALELNTETEANRRKHLYEVVLPLVSDVEQWINEKASAADRKPKDKEALEDYAQRIAGIVYLYESCSRGDWAPKVAAMLERDTRYEIASLFTELAEYDANELSEEFCKELQADRAIHAACRVLADVDRLDARPETLEVQACIDLFARIGSAPSQGVPATGLDDLMQAFALAD